MAIAPITVFDSFTRTDTNGWTISDSGHQWRNGDTTDSNDGRLDSASGVGTITIASGDASSFKSTVHVNITNSENVVVLVKMQISSTALAGPAVRISDNGADYYCVRVDTADRFNICVSIDGTLTELSNVAKTLATNTYYWVRFQSTSTRLMAKIWADGVVEPGSWDIDIAESGVAGAPTGGDIGMFYQGNSAATTVTIQTFYGYQGSPSEDALPVIDNFTNNCNVGFGMASDSFHLWEGAFADDPNAYASANTKIGSKASSVGTITVSTQEELYGAIGPSGTDYAVCAKVRMGSSTSCEIHIGLRATLGFSSGLAEITDGYRLRIGTSLTSIYIHERNSSGSWTQIASDTGWSFSSNTDYWMFFEATGTTLRGKVWTDGSLAPAAWDVTVTDATIASGRAFLEIDNTTSSSRTNTIKYFAVIVPTPISISGVLASATGDKAAPSIARTITSPLQTSTSAALTPVDSITVTALLQALTGDTVAPTISGAKMGGALAAGSGQSYAPTIPSLMTGALATATGAALSASLPRSLAAAAATGSAQAYTITIARLIAGALATATGVENTPSLVATIAGVLSTGSADTLVPSLISNTVISAELATATLAALLPALSAVYAAPVSTAALQELVPTLVTSIAAALSTASGAAYATTMPLTIAVAAATGSGESLVPSVIYAATIGAILATSTAEAYPASVDSSVVVAALAALMTGAVNSAVITAQLAANIATALGDTSTPSIARITSPSAMTASGAASQPSLQEKISAALAQASGVANIPTLIYNSGIVVSAVTANASAEKKIPAKLMIAVYPNRVEVFTRARTPSLFLRSQVNAAVASAIADMRTPSIVFRGSVNADVAEVLAAAYTPSIAGVIRAIVAGGNGSALTPELVIFFYITLAVRNRDLSLIAQVRDLGLDVRERDAILNVIGRDLGLDVAERVLTLINRGTR